MTEELNLVGGIHPEEFPREKARLTDEEIAVHKLYGARGFAGYDIEGLLQAQQDNDFSIIREEIEEIPNPYSCRLDIPRCIGFDKAKQDILSKLREVNNDG